ncbi:MAG: hypothetical protein HFI74_08040 [Lachnospiraceae bacterium]|jgi:hypothetical protein|nr:hypothetical protein [Lachnospiraceae bacterium]
MYTLLQQLYEGNICPAEQYHPLQEEYKKMQQEHSQHYSDFVQTLEQLDPPLDKLFMEIMDEQLNTMPLNFSSMFIDGFCLGAQMMIEIFTNHPSTHTKENGLSN